MNMPKINESSNDQASVNLCLQYKVQTKPRGPHEDPHRREALCLPVLRLPRKFHITPGTPQAATAQGGEGARGEGEGEEEGRDGAEVPALISETGVCMTQGKETKNDARHRR